MAGNISLSLSSMQKESKPDENGRTTGGAGGTTTTVTSLSQLAAAASASGRAIILVQGNLSGAAKVQVTSDKTIIGKAGSCMAFLSPACCSIA
jgi:pectate lyase